MSDYTIHTTFTKYISNVWIYKPQKLYKLNKHYLALKSQNFYKLYNQCLTYKIQTLLKNNMFKVWL